jgi:predicted ATPase
MSDGSRAWHQLARDKRLVQRLNAVLTQLEVSYALRVNNPADMLQIHSDELSYLVKTLQDTKTTPKAKSAAVSDLLTTARSKNGSPYIELVETKTLLQVSHRDVGIGISQVLPILASCYGDSRSTICIEQPELHLHPRLQGNLADVFIETSIGSKQNNTYIIETHSEHIIRRLMRRVREGKISKDDISIVYVESGPTGSTVTSIRMDEDGDLIDEWPNGFFEEGFRDDMAGR